MVDQKKLLIIDDEEDLCEILQFNLRAEGFYTEVVYSAEDALKKNVESFDLIILDVMMGKMSGFKLTEKIRQEISSSIPIVFLTAKNTENDLLTGFGVGGDDYITKPFSVNEVIARVKAILKRTEKKNEINKSSVLIEGMELNFSKKILLIEKKKIQLTKKEFEILTLLVKNTGKIYTRTEIFNIVWDDQIVVTERTIDVHIAHLRKKLGKYGRYLKSMTGYGYTFEIEN